MLTSAEILETNQALLEANGDFPAASMALGITEQLLHDRVQADEALKLRWKDDPKLPPATSILNRPEDVAIAEAIRREDEMLSKSLDGLGMSKRSASMALACQKFQKANYSKVIQITGGGITKAFLEALEEIENINKRLEMLDVPPEQMIAYECLLREDRSRLLDFVYKASVKVDQSVMIQAKIQKMFGDDSGKANDKPGFRTLKKAGP